MTTLKNAGVIGKLLNDFPPQRSNLIPMLQAIQGRLGYLSKDAIENVSEYTRVSEAEIYGMASFYTQFRFSPAGKHMFTICRGTACHVLGSQKLVDEIENTLNIKPGGTTPDLQFSLETVACFGSCALAPLAVVDGKVYGRMTSQKIRQLVESLRDDKPEKTPKEKKKKAVTPKKAAGKKAVPKKPTRKTAAKTKTTKKKTAPKKSKATKKSAGRRTR